MYVQVLLPLKLRWIPTYISDTPLLRGEAVKVIFSGRRYTGIVWTTEADAPAGVKRMLKVLGRDEAVPSLDTNEMALWNFIADYYLCTLGEVFAMALPGLRLRSEQNNSAAIARLSSRVNTIEEQLTGRHCERVRLRLESKKAELLSRIAEISPESIPASDIAIPDAGSLTKPETDRPAAAPKDRRPRLLIDHDRMASYIDAAREQLDSNCQVLLLAPEVAFADNLEKALAEEFGPRLAVVHSGKSPAARQRAATRLRSGQPLLVLGTRSSIFLPFHRLGLVIIDEEQDPFYKQSEPAPRYNGRDCAIYLAALHSARVLLGTACPSLETLLNLHGGKYVAALKGRGENGATDTSLPPDQTEADKHQTVIDIASERRKNGMKGPLSRRLIAAVHAAGGPTLLIRGWEKQEELEGCISANLQDEDISVCTLAELKRNGSGGAVLIAVLQADALLSKDDFRSDERALQLMAMLREFSPEVIIQTEVPQRFSTSLDALLAERRQFGFPPYTRIVDIRRYGSGELAERIFLQRDASLASRKAEIFASLPDDCYADVDPQ